jgi:RNA polymerase sigma factor (sigma-70 family)
MNDHGDREIERLLARARRGDPVALDAVFPHLATRFERVASRLRRRYPAVAAREGTGDVFQPALMKLLRQYRDDPRRVPEDATRLGVHVVQALHDVCRDRARKYRGPHAIAWKDDDPVSADELAGDDTTASGRAMRREEAESVRRAVDALPPHLGEVVKQYYSGRGMALGEIAAVHGVTDKTVSRWLDEARRLLKDRLS